MAKNKYETYRQIFASSLTNDQKWHLVYRLDKHTICGWVTAMRIAKSKILADVSLVEIFEWAGQTRRSACILTKKVLDCKLNKIE